MGMDMGSEISSVKRMAVEKLLSKDLEMAEFMNSEEIDALIPQTLIPKIEEEVYYRWVKWSRKKQPNADEAALKEIEKRFKRSHAFRVGLDEVISNVLGYSQIFGGLAFDYKRFAYSLASILKKLHPATWVDASKQHIEAWKIKHNGDERILKAIVLATGKWVWKYYFG